MRNQIRCPVTIKGTTNTYNASRGKISLEKCMNERQATTLFNKQRPFSSSTKWSLRNDSRAVSALLCPELPTPRPATSTISSISSHCCSRGVTRKERLLSKNDCYCKDQLPPPTLLPHPRNCVIAEGEKRGTTVVGAPRTTTKEAAVFKLVDQPTTLYERLKRARQAQNRTIGIQEPLKYTNDRKDYEMIKHTVHDVIMEEYEKSDITGNGEKDEVQKVDAGVGGEVGYSEGEKLQPSVWLHGHAVGTTQTISSKNIEKDQEVVAINFEDSVSDSRKNTIPSRNITDFRSSYSTDISEAQRLDTGSEFHGTQIGSSVSASDAKSDQDKDSLKNLNEFRVQNYFETHDVNGDLNVKTRSKETSGDYLNDVRQHVCVHKFTLDERLFPVASNTDVYGTSRCLICSKPMVPLKPRTKDDREGKSCPLPAYYVHGRVPVKVNIGGDSRIVIKLDRKQARQLGNCLSTLRRPVYTNTMALRFQRGVV